MLVNVETAKDWDLHFCDIIDASDGKDWVRDVSLPTTDPIWR